MTREDYERESVALDKEVSDERYRHEAAVQGFIERRIQLNSHEFALRGTAKWSFGWSFPEKTNEPRDVQHRDPSDQGL